MPAIRFVLESALFRFCFGNPASGRSWTAVSPSQVHLEGFLPLKQLTHDEPYFSRRDSRLQASNRLHEERSLKVYPNLPG